MVSSSVSQVNFGGSFWFAWQDQLEVKDLVVLSDGQRNSNALPTVYDSFTANLISNIPISRRGTPDWLAWIELALGSYSVEELPVAYPVFMEVM